MVQHKKKLLILGGTSSISRAILENTKILAFDVTATYRNDSLKFEGKNQINWIQLDIASEDSCQNFLEVYSELNPDCTILAIGKLSKSAQNSNQKDALKKYLQTYAVYYPLLITQMARLQEGYNRRKFFFNISSRSAVLGSYDSNYAVSKSAVHVLMKSLPKTYGNRLSCYNLVLGLIEGSNMFHEMSKQEQQNHQVRAGGRLVQLDNCAEEIIEIVKSRISLLAECENQQLDIAIGTQYQ